MFFLELQQHAGRYVFTTVVDVIIHISGNMMIVIVIGVASVTAVIIVLSAINVSCLIVVVIRSMCSISITSIIINMFMITVIAITAMMISMCKQQTTLLSTLLFWQCSNIRFSDDTAHMPCSWTIGGGVG